MEPMDESEKTPFRSWVLILTLALLFVAWGLFIFFTVGDKGPPSWNFGAVGDVPGESRYSTHPPARGKGAEPEPQHVSGRPSRAPGEERKDKP